MRKASTKKSAGRKSRLSLFVARSSLWLRLGLLLFAMPLSALAQSTQNPSATTAQGSQPVAPATSSATTQPLGQQSSGTISGTIVDQSGAAVAGAQVTLTRDDQSPKRVMPSGDDGQFSFDNLAPGAFHLTITAPGFATQTYSGVLNSGEASIVPEITLILAAATTQVRVGLTPTEMAEVQIQTEEAQRVLGFIPNFYVSYVSDAVPLTPKEKLDRKSVV